MSLLELARSLNIVETIELNGGVLTNSKQNFKHLIVIDFEATCWNKQGEEKCRQSEIIGRKYFLLCRIWSLFEERHFFRIEFPAVLVDLSTQKILSEFHQYIRPVESPQLSEFCINLTGITQEKIDHNSVPLQTGLLNFGQWLNESIEKYKLLLPKVSSETNEATTAFMTWSDWDFEVCLTKECERKKIKKPQYFDRWIDLKAAFKVTFINDFDKNGRSLICFQIVCRTGTSIDRRTLLMP